MYKCILHISKSMIWASSLYLPLYLKYCNVTDSSSVGQAGTEMMAALTWAKHGALYRTACSLHDTVSELNRHSLSWGRYFAADFANKHHAEQMFLITNMLCKFHVGFCCLWGGGAMMLVMGFKTCMWPKRSMCDAMFCFFNCCSIYVDIYSNSFSSLDIYWV